MFYNWYQTGSSLELYNPNNKDILSQWSFVGNVQKVYDKSIKSHIHSLHSGSLCKMILPKNNSTSLGIVQGFMVFQLYLFHLKNFSIEIAISDTQKTKHRLIFSTHLKDFNLNYFSALIPLGEFPIGVWVNFSVDVLGFVTHCFKGMTFKSIDSVMVSADCKIRRIFTMRGKIKVPELESEGNVSSNNNNNNEIESDIPKKMKIETTDKGVSVICVNYNVEVVKRYLLGVYGNYSEPKEVVTNNNSNNKRKSSKDCSFSNNTNSNNSSFTYINSGSSHNNSKMYNKSKSRSKSPPNERLNLRVVGEKQYPNMANVVKAIQQQQQPQIKIKKRSPNNSKERNVKRYQTDNSVNNTQNNNNNNKEIQKGNVSSIENQGNKISNKEDMTNVVKFNNFNLEKGNVAGSIEELIESQQREQQQVIQTSLSNIKGVQLVSQSTTSNNNNNNKSITPNKPNKNHHELFPSSSLNDGGIDLTKSRERPYSPPLSKIINN